MRERLQVMRARPERVVDWWGGIGGGGAELALAYPDARRVAVEPTKEWLERSKAEAQRPWWSPTRWRGPTVEVVAEDQALSGPAQLVWANMVVHAVDDPPSLFARWNTLLDVDGFVMLSCLGPGTLRELRTLYAELDWPSPTPGFIDMHDLGDMLVGAGFADPVMDQEVLTIRWRSAETLLGDLRALGVNAAPERFVGLRTPRWRTRLLLALETLRGDDGSIGLSFEVAYGHGFKVAPRVRSEGATTTVSLDDMRTMVHTSRAPR
jgi:malonyl-CoA O-methyltransferase